MISATAPGKAVLSGEYAVLHSAPAIATAIDRRVHVTVSESQDDQHSITTPGFLAGRWHFRRIEDGDIEWQERLPTASAFSLVEQIWNSFATAQWPSLDLIIDTQEFCDAETGVKFGLGSSAAVSVALIAALQKYVSCESDRGKLAMDAHRRFQSGRGSGVDVAASLHGGVIEYRRAGAATRKIAWPAGLHYRFLWSGQIALTAEKLAKLRVRDATDDRMNLLNAAAEKVAAAWSGGDCRQILDTYPDYIDSLRQFSIDQDLGIFDAGHEELVQLATDVGTVYKPCGAGGGDIGIVLGEDEGVMKEFCAQAGQQGFRGLDMAIDEQGVQLAE